MSLPSAGATVSAPSPDPRVGLRAGWWDAGEAIWNLRKVSESRPSSAFTNPSTPGDPRLKNSDLAFTGNLAFQGNYSGWQVWDISDPARPRVVQAYVCPGAQSDVTVYRNLLFVSAEATSGRIDCGLQGVTDTVSAERARGVRVYDISNIRSPRSLGIVQTCRGSHTNTLVVDPDDTENVYIYVSGASSIRSPRELPGCSGGPVEENPNTSDFRIEVIRVPLANPAAAAIVSSPRIFQDLAPAPANVARDRPRPATEERPRTGPTQCHDITTYPAIGLAGGACRGYGFLLDISNVTNPVRVSAVADSNFAFWHSATFDNEGTKVLFTDEWGGGTQPRCRASDRPEWGADAIFTIGPARQMTFQSYYKLPAAQTEQENCVAHNGSLIPVPGRDIMVQSWYQGGIDVFDWTDPENPVEIAFFDRGPMSDTTLLSAGHWSAYWYNGYIYASEISRGLDVFELRPSPMLTQNEIDAAKTVQLDYFNPQMQPKFVWPASFVVARAYLDQLARGNGIARDRAEAIAVELASAERLSGAQRSAAVTTLAAQLDRDAQVARDAERVRRIAAVLRELAGQGGR